MFIWPVTARRHGRCRADTRDGPTSPDHTRRGQRTEAARTARGDHVHGGPGQPAPEARRTCELAGFAAVARVTPDLVEWDYGDYDGRLTSDIRRERPGWYLFRDGCPGGESLAEVGACANRVVARLRADGGRILLFGHGHFSRILAARRMDLPVEDARHLLLSTASLSIVGYEHTLADPAIILWNDDHHVKPCA